MRQACVLTAVVLVLGSVAFATIFGSVRGVVHDPQHRPIPGAQVTLKAQNSDWTQSQDSDDNGEFRIHFRPDRELHGHGLVAGLPVPAAKCDRAVGHKSGAALPVNCGGHETNRRSLRNSRGGDHGQRHADHHAEP